MLLENAMNEAEQAIIGAEDAVSKKDKEITKLVCFFGVLFSLAHTSETSVLCLVWQQVQSALHCTSGLKSLGTSMCYAALPAR